MEAASPLRTKLHWNSPYVVGFLRCEMEDHVPASPLTSRGTPLFSEKQMQAIWHEIGVFRSMAGPQGHTPEPGDWATYQIMALQTIHQQQGTTPRDPITSDPHWHYARTLVETYFETEKKVVASATVVGVLITGTIKELQHMDEYLPLRVTQHQEKLPEGGKLYRWGYLMPEPVWEGLETSVAYISTPTLTVQGGDPVAMGLFTSWIEIETALALWDPNSSGGMRRLGYAASVARRV